MTNATPQTVVGLLMFLREQCTGIKTTGCNCPTCQLFIDIQFYDAKRREWYAASKAAEAAEIREMMAAKAHLHTEWIDGSKIEVVE